MVNLKEYGEYKIPPTKSNDINKFCAQKDFKLQKPQMFLPVYVNKPACKGILIFHKIGSGKTCTAIRIGLKHFQLHKKPVIVVLPAALRTNFLSELRSKCTAKEFISDEDRKALDKLDPKSQQYLSIIEKTNKRISRVFVILSYQKFVKLIDTKSFRLSGLVLIDEIHNLVSESGKSYEKIQKAVDKAHANLKLVLLSATPMFDKPNELATTLNLLKLKTPIPTGKDFDNMFISPNGNKVINETKLKKYIAGLISFYKGAPDFTFPQLLVKYVNCELSSYQYKELEKQDSSKKDFYSHERNVSNISLPSRGITGITKDNLDKYSVKFAKICKGLRRSGKAFVYSNFKEHGGLKSLAKVLELFDYKNYFEHGKGKKRYVLWSGDEDDKLKDEIKQVFNGKDNLEGQKLKVVLGSPSIKEGVSFKAVANVHILEPYWNMSRIEQILGRAVRFCSHIDLPEEKRVVKAFIYVATYKETVTADMKMKEMAENKNKLIKKFETIIKESAVDCNLNLNSTNYGLEENEKIVCDTDI